MQVVFLCLLFILGACFGSFLCCQARRLHLHKKSLPKRSVCLHCKKKLKWYDNIPIISWLLLRGKCRYCHKKIGLAEFLSELSMAAAWLLIGLNFNFSSATALEWGILVATLIFTFPVIFVAIYDGLYGEMPTVLLWVAVFLGAVVLGLKTWQGIIISDFSSALILNPVGSVLVLGGIYLLLYLVSRGKWVGDGDWILGVALGLSLASGWSALLALFFANLSACIVMLPVVKKNKTHQIHFGPFLVLGFFIGLIL